MRVSPHSEAVAFDWAAAVRLLSAFNRHQNNPPPKTVFHAGYPLDIYDPRKSPKASVIFIPGLAIHGREDCRMRQLASALCAAGLRVVVPDIPSIRSLRVTSGQSHEVRGLVEILVNESSLGVTENVALMSVSFSSVFALDIARQGTLGTRLKGVGIIGGYSDIESVASFLIKAKRADPYGKLIISRSYLLETEPDNYAESDALKRAVESSALNPKAPNRLCDLFDLTDSIQAGIYERLTDTDYCDDFYLKILDHLDDQWSGYRLAGDFPHDMSPVFILHGRHDRIIPSGEAKRLAQRFSRQKLPHFLCMSELLNHGNSDISMRKFFEVYRLLKGFAWFLGQIGRAR